MIIDVLYVIKNVVRDFYFITCSIHVGNIHTGIKVITRTL